MRTRTIASIAAVAFVVVLAAAFAARPGPQTAAAGGAPPVHGGHGKPGHDQKHGKLQERYLYVSTIAQSKTDPDFISVIGADPRRRDFGKIVNRIDMPNVGSPAGSSRSTTAPERSRRISVRVRCAAPATSVPSTCTTSSRCPR